MLQRSDILSTTFKFLNRISSLSILSLQSAQYSIVYRAQTWTYLTSARFCVILSLRLSRDRPSNHWGWRGGFGGWRRRRRALLELAKKGETPTAAVHIIQMSIDELLGSFNLFVR
jgi:hypothetical protein